MPPTITTKLFIVNKPAVPVHSTHTSPSEGRKMSSAHCASTPMIRIMLLAKGSVSRALPVRDSLRHSAAPVVNRTPLTKQYSKRRRNGWRQEDQWTIWREEEKGMK